MVNSSDVKQPLGMLFAQAGLVPGNVDAETGIQKVELRRTLDEGLVKFEQGERVIMDDPARDRLRDELRGLR